jgi:hypothetical protein
MSLQRKSSDNGFAMPAGLPAQPPIRSDFALAAL